MFTNSSPGKNRAEGFVLPRLLPADKWQTIVTKQSHANPINPVNGIGGRQKYRSYGNHDSQESFTERTSKIRIELKLIIYCFSADLRF